MAVADVNDPKVYSRENPRVNKNVPEDIQNIKNEVEKARLGRELMQENKLTENLSRPEEPPDAPFKITGGVNLGTIDLQEQQREAKAAAEKANTDAQTRIDIANRERDTAREALNQTNLVHVQQTLGGQIEALRASVNSGKSRDIFSEIEAIEAMASKLGFSRENGQPTKNDFESQIQLERLKQEIKRDDRKFMLQMKTDDRMWQLEVKKLEQSALESAAKMEAERNKFAMLASLPEQLGANIAKGMMNKGADTGMAGQPATQPGQAPAQPIGITAGEGEYGTLECPKCKAEVAIGPTAKASICAQCQQKFIINREPVPEGYVDPRPARKDPNPYIENGEGEYENQLDGN